MIYDLNENRCGILLNNYGYFTEQPIQIKHMNKFVNGTHKLTFTSDEYNCAYNII
jgi:hypothetical protein